MLLTKEQRQYLLTRVQNHYSNSRYLPVPPVPAKVVAAQKVVADHNEKRKAQGVAHTKAIEKARSEVQEAIEFKGVDAALAAVQQFEKKFPTPTHN